MGEGFGFSGGGNDAFPLETRKPFLCDQLTAAVSIAHPFGALCQKEPIVCGSECLAIHFQAGFSRGCQASGWMMNFQKGIRRKIIEITINCAAN